MLTSRLILNPVLNKSQIQYYHACALFRLKNQFQVLWHASRFYYESLLQDKSHASVSLSVCNIEECTNVRNQSIKGIAGFRRLTCVCDRGLKHGQHLNLTPGTCKHLHVALVSSAGGIWIENRSGKETYSFDMLCGMNVCNFHGHLYVISLKQNVCGSHPTPYSCCTCLECSAYRVRYVQARRTLPGDIFR